MTKNDKYAGLPVETLIVEHNHDMTTFPYTIKRVMAWGVSDGTFSNERGLQADLNGYHLVSQIDGADIYEHDVHLIRKTLDRSN